MGEATILLVDDEKTILDSLKTQLRHVFGARFTYEGAENVAEAWEVIEDLYDEGVRIVVVVSDWLMPDVRGDQFLLELRQRHPAIIRIMLTGQADADAVQRAYEQAAVHCVLRKPWSIAELSGAIEKELTT